MLKHILIPLDGSLVAERSIEAAKTVLRPQGKFTVISVIQGGQVPTPEAEVETARAENAMEQLQSYLERIASNLKLNGYEAEIEIREGEPAAVIAEVAVILGVEMIVMCTHGRSGLSRLLTGSVTLEVLNRTPCPVLVIPNRERKQVKEAVAEGNTAPSLAD
jgi:nucleotide-binding universal stress UspA family protein